MMRWKPISEYVSGTVDLWIDLSGRVTDCYQVDGQWYRGDGYGSEDAVEGRVTHFLETQSPISSGDPYGLGA